MTSTQIAYRQAAVQGASGFGLLISLYDSLIADLVRAAEAQQSGRIERRVNQVNHALLILGFMENWIDPESGGELATPLLRFYAELRSSLLVAQARQSVQMLQQHIPELLHLRSIWQDIELDRIGVREEFPGIAPQAIEAVQSSGAAFSWTI
jgi:flagellar biosynthetic protein FliS